VSKFVLILSDGYIPYNVEYDEDDDEQSSFAGLTISRLCEVFSIGTHKVGCGSPLTPSSRILDSASTLKNDPLSDVSCLRGIYAFVVRTRSVLVPYFTELVNTDDVELHDSPHPALLQAWELRQWDPTGVSLEQLADALCSGKVTPRDANMVLRAEGQLFRCMLSTSDSAQRLYLLVAWCWVVSLCGFESEVVTILALAHDIGTHMASLEDKPTRLKHHFLRAFEFTEMLNHKWAILLTHVFSLRKPLSAFAKDLVLCQYHLPFKCPKTVERGDIIVEEEKWLMANPEGNQEDFYKFFGYVNTEDEADDDDGPVWGM
jgi:hypothetical protein